MQHSARHLGGISTTKPNGAPALRLLRGSADRATFTQTAARRLDDLWAAAHRSRCPDEVRSLLSTMLSPWGAKVIPRVPEWPSDIGDEHSPLEFSVALTPGKPEVRLVVEAQGDEPSYPSTLQAGLRLNEALERRGASLERFERVRDLFLPDVDRARFGLWHAVALAPGPLHVKTYLNPQIRGGKEACTIVGTALDRLGMRAAWSTIESALPAGPVPGEAMRYFALDLERSPTARAKVYLYSDGIGADDIENLACLRPGYVRGEVTAFCRALTGTSGPYASRPPAVYLAFTGNDATPSDVTVQIPIRYYVSDDRVARDRVLAYLRSRQLDTAPYERVLEAVALRSLEAGSGLHSYVSLRTGSAPARVTTYFAAELYEPADRSRVLDRHAPLGGAARFSLRGRRL
jgi:DMATS type aromatic prenyltransferase